MEKLKFWGEKRFNNLNYALKQEFNEKVYKLSLDGGFTCPNRDGKISTEGCIFCNEEGSGDFAGDRNVNISDQIEQQKILLGKKFKGNKFIAYFQNFTNTYADINYLKKVYYEAINSKGIVGIAIATRPDCLSDEVIELLKEINKITFLWIEFGLQTIHKKTSELINRGYKLEVFDDFTKVLIENNIKIVVHIIIGLPNENEQDILESIKYISNFKIWGIKLHMLYITKNTNLHHYYIKNKFNIMNIDQYINLIVKIIENLNQNIVIHRLTGDAKREDLIEPLWSLNKKTILNNINKELKLKDTYQGKNIKKNIIIIGR